jgi:hypothetical protein
MLTSTATRTPDASGLIETGLSRRAFPSHSEDPPESPIDIRFFVPDRLLGGDRSGHYPSRHAVKIFVVTTNCWAATNGDISRNARVRPKSACAANYFA